MFVCSCMLPPFDYGDVVYMCAAKESLDKLQTAQNRACRTILNEGRRANVDSKHNRLKLMC